MACNDISGSNGSIKLKQETDFGLQEKTGFIQVPFNSFSLKYNQNSVESPTISSGRSPTQAGFGNVEISGSLEGPLDSKSTGIMLKGLFGAVATVADGAKFKHTYSISDTCLPSFNIEKSFNGTNLNYLSTGVKINSFSLDVGGEGQLNATYELMGKNETLNTVAVDSATTEMTAGALINSKSITVLSATGFETGDVITFKNLKSQLATAAKKGSSVIEVDSAAGLVAGEFLEIGEIDEKGEFYQVKVISSNKIYLSRALEKDYAIDSSVASVNSSHKITGVVGNVISFEPGLKAAVIAGDIVYGEGASVLLNGVYFQNFEAEVFSDSESSIIDVESVKFSFSNNAEGKRTIDSKGSFGKISEGKVSVSAELTMVFTVENAGLLERAKMGSKFDLKIRAVSADGDYIEFLMPTGTLTPSSPEISSPTSISVSLTYNPFKDGVNDAITVNLVNDVASY